MKHVIALHSSQSRGSQWRALSKLLCQAGVELKAPDLIGYGEKEPYRTSQSPFTFQNEIDQLLENKVDFNNSILVGHSYGGALALNIAFNYPEAVKGLVLYEPVAFHLLPADSEARTEILSVSNAMNIQNEAEACEQFVDYWNFRGYFKALPRSVQRVMVEQQNKVSADFDALIRPNLTMDDYKDLSCPVTLISGKQSPLSSRTVAQMLSEHLPNVHYQQVDAGHMGPMTHANLVTPIITAATLELLGSQ